MLRVAYLVLAALVAIGAGAYCYSQTRQAEVVVATRDLMSGTQLSGTDVSVRTVPVASVPQGTVSDPASLEGQFVAFPILAGQFVNSRQLASRPTGQLLAAGLPIPAGYAVLSIPISASAAVGGALHPGDRVDVLAAASSKSALAEGNGDLPVRLGHSVLVVGLRTDQGTAVDSSQPGNSPDSSTERPTSVLLAIPEADEPAYASAISGSTFMLALSGD